MLRIMGMPVAQSRHHRLKSVQHVEVCPGIQISSGQCGSGVENEKMADAGLDRKCFLRLLGCVENFTFSVRSDRESLHKFTLLRRRLSISGGFMYFTGLGSGIGSTNVFADRSTFGGAALCRFRRTGKTLLVIQENTGFRASQGSPDLKRSVEYSFPASVLAALPIEADENGTLLVDAQNLVIRDAVDLLSQLRRPTRAVGGALIRD